MDVGGETMSPYDSIFALWVVWAASWLIAAFWSDRAARRPPMGSEMLYRLVTVIGFFLLFTPERHSRPQWFLHGSIAWVPVGFVLAGFLFCWWARLHLGRLWSGFVTRKADHHIVDTGPYAIVRHPIYTGIILAAFATAAAKGTALGLLGAAIGTFGFWIKARLEERFLRQELGADAYDAYRRRVPMLVPLGPRAA